MSKAFTREDDANAAEPAALRPLSALPFGAKNYMTVRSAQQLREELERLIQSERPQIAAEAKNQNGAGSSSSQAALQAMDQRIRYLQQSLQSAVVVMPPTAPEDRVRFGAAVTVREKHGDESTYRIVGVDEVNLDRNWVSWLSPIAKTLMNAKLGQRVRFKFPSGDTELEIVEISWEE